jgi:hypothetical protein
MRIVLIENKRIGYDRPELPANPSGSNLESGDDEQSARDRG